MVEDSILLIAFRGPDFFYDWSVMPFERTNGLAFFVDLMNRVFRNVLNKFVLVFIDDILIYSKTREEHEHRLEVVLETLRKNVLKAKFSTCHFWQSELRYLRHIVSGDDISVDPTKIAVVQDFKKSQTPTEVRSFLGMAGYYRKFTKDYSKIVAHITKLTGKNVKFKWTSKCEDAFLKLKERLTGAPVLAIIDGE